MDNSIIELLKNVREKCIATDEALLKELNITQAIYSFCLASLTCKTLETPTMVEKMNISVSRLSRVVEKMVQDDLLERVTSKTDRRAIKLSFTTKGKKIVKRIKAHRESCELKITKNLSPEMVDQLKASLKHLIDTA